MKTTWQDWFSSRVYFLTNFAKEPTKEARKIAQAEMIYLGGPVLSGTWAKPDEKRASHIKIAEPAVKLDKRTHEKIRRAVIMAGGAVKTRSRIDNPITGTWTKRVRKTKGR